MEIEVIVPPPTNVHLTFEDPKIASVHFKSLMTEWVPDEHKGCQFFETPLTDTYYTTVSCFSIEAYGPQSPWIVFKTPTNWKVGLPKEAKPHVSTPNSGVELKLSVQERFNVDLSWSLHFVNKTLSKKLKSVGVSVHRKRPFGKYKSALLKQGQLEGKIRVGLSPSYTFDLGCYFYSLNATFVDE
ncbi:hypothetical protein ANCCAN_10287, partial [Ancylostoma caninum]